MNSMKLLVAALLLAGCAEESVAPEAAKEKDAALMSAEQMAESMPPENFRGDYTTLATVATMPPERVSEVCGSKHALACAGREDRFDVLYLPNPCGYPDDPYAVLMCHELAHLQSWQHGVSDEVRCQGIMALDSTCRDFVLGRKPAQ